MTVLLLEPIGESFSEKRINLTNDVLKVGRKISAKNPPEPYNGIFESKVLSRAHAEIWNDKGKVLIKDVGSSNGTFINGKRISEEGQPSAAFELHTGDILEFGIDIKNEEGDDILYRKVSAKVKIISDDSSQNYSEVMINFETILDKQIEKAENTQAELELIKNIISDLTSKIESIPPTVSKKKILMELDEAHNQERLWIDKYTNLLQSSKQNEKDLEILKMDNQNLADDNEYTKCQLEISEDRIRELEEKQTFYEKENQIVKDEYAKMRTDYKSLSEKLEKEEKQNEKFKKRINELEENYSKVKYENMDDINIAHDQVNELNKKIEQLNEKIEFLEMEKKDIIVSKNDIRDELNYQKNEFKQKIEDWKAKEKTWTEDMNRLKSEMESKSNENDELTKEIQILKEESSNSNNNISSNKKGHRSTSSDGSSATTTTLTNENLNSSSSSYNTNKTEVLEQNNKKLIEENEKLKKSIEEEKQMGKANLKEWNSHKNRMLKEKESLEKEKEELSQQLKELQEWKLNKEKEEKAASQVNKKTIPTPISPLDEDLITPTAKTNPNQSTLTTPKDTNPLSNNNVINRKNKNKNKNKNRSNSNGGNNTPLAASNKIENENDVSSSKNGNANKKNGEGGGSYEDLSDKDEENLPPSLVASSTSSLATIDNFRNDNSKHKQEQVVEDENAIIELTKTVVIPLVTGILFSVLFNYFFMSK